MNGYRDDLSSLCIIISCFFFTYTPRLDHTISSVCGRSLISKQVVRAAS